MSLFEKHKDILDGAVKAIHARTFYAQYPEHPKAYGEDAGANGMEAYKTLLGKHYDELESAGSNGQIGDETSPYLNEPLGITYPSFEIKTLIDNSNAAYNAWRKVDAEERVGILVESLENIKERFFEIGYATMHTTGQSFMMSFQASGPHANDRALEAISMGYDELTRFPKNVTWEKPMGKISVTLQKSWYAIPRGIGLVIGCSTFPIWNSVPGIFADLVTGNSVIVKPHPKVILPIAIVVAEIQKTFKANGQDPNTIQLAVDTADKPLAKELAEHADVKLIDYTGNQEFGDYLETLKDKVVFTEKTGVNSVILDSMDDLDAAFQNLAFSVSLYSGQMCTAPQNFFIPQSGITVGGENVSYDDVVQKLKENVTGLVNHPKMGAGTLGAIQNENTVTRVNEASKLGVNVILNTNGVENEEFPNARVCSPIILEVDASKKDIYEKEMFGPIVMIIKTKDTNDSIAIAKEMAQKHGAISCAAYTTDKGVKQKIGEEMALAYTPVSFNLVGPIWVNQNAAFSDFHVTGGNPAGNASFTNPEFIVKRFVWVGHREIA
ncbi:MAG: phenylacetic acid degradation protein PaaN [Bacteroidetes bacterium]|nr:phenylacetic acid degradation protein PaaN [Bacteroidota bacterium]